MCVNNADGSLVLTGEEVRKIACGLRTFERERPMGSKRLREIIPNISRFDREQELDVDHKGVWQSTKNGCATGFVKCGFRHGLKDYSEFLIVADRKYERLEHAVCGGTYKGPIMPIHRLTSGGVMFKAANGGWCQASVVSDRLRCWLETFPPGTPVYFRIFAR